MVYADVEIRIFKRNDDRYPVEITVDGGDVFTHGYLDAAAQPPHPTDARYADAGYGKKLYAWFFADQVLAQSWGQIRGAYPQRRVRLRIDADEPYLHTLAWEALCEPSENNLPALYLAAHSATPFSRYLAIDKRQGRAIVSPPLRILVAAPEQDDFEELFGATSNSGMARIVAAGEFAAIKVALKPLLDQGQVTLTLLPQPCTLGSIAQEIMRGYHVLHLICHGAYNDRTQQTSLLLADENNRVKPVTDADVMSALGQQLNEAPSGNADRLQLVFLASCESATRSSADAFRGLAPRLLATGVPAVLAMQGLVGEETARTFAAVFYERLLAHGQVDRAGNEARQIIMAAQLGGPVIPVLFLRLRDGRLLAEEGAPRERIIFETLLDDYAELFAGREAQLTELEQFMKEPAGGYLLVKAEAGLGKTALLANLVKRHQAEVAYHFFTPNLDDSLQEAVFLRSLLEQMGPWYGKTDPPTGQPDELRKRYDALLGKPPGAARTVVLDGLDELSGWNLARYLTRKLPGGLHFILSVRDTGRDPVADYSLPPEQTRTLALTGLTREGVRAVLRAAGEGATRFAEDDNLLDKLMAVTEYDKARPELGADTFFVRLLAEDLAAGELGQVESDTLPESMQEYLKHWYNAIRPELGTPGKAEIDQAMMDLIGTLVAALGPIGRTDLQAIYPKTLTHPLVKQFFNELIQRARKVLRAGQGETYSLIHPRLRSYLREMIETQTYEDKLLAYCAEWPRHKSRYTLGHYAAHLLLAAGRPGEPQRSLHIATAVDLVADHRFQDEYLTQLRDLRGLQADLQRVLELVAQDDARESLPLLVKSALALVEFRRERLRPEPMFDLAAQGDLAGARRMLDLFEMDLRWQHVVLLELAWLGSAAQSSAGRDQARSLLRETAAGFEGAPADDQRKMLLAIIAADLAGAIPPVGNLPPPPSQQNLRNWLNASAGVSAEADVTPEMMMPLSGLNWDLIVRGLELSEDSEMSENLFFSHYIGPQLVALTVADAQNGEEYLAQYFGVHSAYNYANYRFGSLWALLRPILQHPDPAWIKKKVRVLLSSALGGSSHEFEQGLPAAVLALRARADAGAGKELAEYVAQVQQDANTLTPGRLEGDTWGYYNRLLATFALLASIPEVELGVQSSVLLGTAVYVPYGYAGYEALARLTLAEAIHVCRPPLADAWIDDTLERAQGSAHNVQEGTFCARTTARVNAMRRRWWLPGSVDVRRDIAALHDCVLCERFAALHVIGHQYAGRSEPPHSFPLPNRIRHANTLAQLTHAYQRGMPEFLRLNRSWEPDQEITPVGTEVNVPDPGLAPLAAARLAAEALASTELTQDERSRLLRSLVPVAAANPTTLDTVLVRLLVAEQPTDPAVLDRLIELAPRVQP